MKPVERLEIHVAHACNLSCESCSHYSDHGHKGLVSLEDADRWMGLWSKHLAPKIFGMLGGEPTIHPELPEFVRLARKHWPQATLRVATNGFFLDRHPSLPAVLNEVGNSHIVLSVHHASREFQQKVLPIRRLLAKWVQEYGIKVTTTESYNTWTRRYEGMGAEMAPFDHGQPRKSWEICPGRTCLQLFEDKLWKCAPLTYLQLQERKYKLSDAWQPYLAYPALAANCSDEALAVFLAREEESYCGMCAAEPQHFVLPDPSIVRKKIPVVMRSSRAPSTE